MSLALFRLSIWPGGGIKTRTSSGFSRSWKMQDRELRRAMATFASTALASTGAISSEAYT